MKSKTLLLLSIIPTAWIGVLRSVYYTKFNPVWFGILRESITIPIFLGAIIPNYALEINCKKIMLHISFSTQFSVLNEA